MPKSSAVAQRDGKKKRKRPRRIVFQPQPGINEPAPYWRGVRAEKIVARRIRGYQEAKSQKRRARGAGGSPRVKTPSQQLSRLQRALTRRKTLAGRQSVQSKIDLLMKELGRA